MNDNDLKLFIQLQNKKLQEQATANFVMQIFQFSFLLVIYKNMGLDLGHAIVTFLMLTAFLSFLGGFISGLTKKDK